MAILLLLIIWNQIITIPWKEWSALPELWLFSSPCRIYQFLSLTKRTTVFVYSNAYYLVCISQVLEDHGLRVEERSVKSNGGANGILFSCKFTREKIVKWAKNKSYIKTIGKALNQSKNEAPQC